METLIPMRYRHEASRPVKRVTGNFVISQFWRLENYGLVCGDHLVVDKRDDMRNKSAVRPGSYMAPCCTPRPLSSNEQSIRVIIGLITIHKRQTFRGKCAH